MYDEFRKGIQMTAIPDLTSPSPETNRRGAPRGNRNALKSGRYTAEAKAARKRKRLLLRQLRAGLEYARSVVRARAAAAAVGHIPMLPDLQKKFSKIEKQFPQGPGAVPGLSHIRSMQVPVKGTLHRRNHMEEEVCCVVMKKFVPFPAKTAILMA